MVARQRRHGCRTSISAIAGFSIASGTQWKQKGIHTIPVVIRFRSFGSQRGHRVLLCAASIRFRNGRVQLRWPQNSPAQSLFLELLKRVSPICGDCGIAFRFPSVVRHVLGHTFARGRHSALYSDAALFTKTPRRLVKAPTGTKSMTCKWVVKLPHQHRYGPALSRVGYCLQQSPAAGIMAKLGSACQIGRVGPTIIPR